MSDIQRFIDATELTSLFVSPDSFPIAPADDVTDLPTPIRALRANGAGVVKAHTPGGGNTVRTLNFAAGETRHVAITRVLNTGTTATGLEGMP
jgi:hypothetical protein